MNFWKLKLYFMAWEVLEGLKQITREPLYKSLGDEIVDPELPLQELLLVLAIFPVVKISFQKIPRGWFLLNVLISTLLK